MAETGGASRRDEAARVDRLGRNTALGAVALALVVAVAAPLQLRGLAAPPIPAAVVVFLAALSLALGLRAVVLRRRARTALAPGFVAAAAAALALVAAAVLAFRERAAALDPGLIGREHEPAMIAWQVGLAQERARELALLGLGALPGFGLALLAMGLALGARRAAKAAATAVAVKPGDGAAPATSVHRKALAAAWSALLGGSALVAAGLAVDAMAILAPVEAPPHPRLADIASMKEDLAHARLADGCTKLERVLAAGTPRELVDVELPGVSEIAHRCVGHGIERLPKGMACVERAAVLANGATAKLAGAEGRVRAACDDALTGE